MENNASKMNQILTNLKDRHRQLDNLMALTKEMEKAIETNDLESLGQILSMRQTSMDRIDSLNLDIKNKLESMDKADEERTRQILDADREPGPFNDQLETDIYKTNKMTLALVQKVIELDQAVNEKIQKSAAPKEPAEQK